jgi:hypothetical protein
MAHPIYAYKRPYRNLLQKLFPRPCLQHDWQQLTGTLSQCAHCRLFRKQLGVLVVETTGELLDAPEMLTWQIPTYNGSSDGWVVPSGRAQTEEVPR